MTSASSENDSASFAESNSVKSATIDLVHEEVAKHFLGALTKEEAEAAVSPGEFRLYYRVPRSDFPPELRLFVVYFSNSSRFRHFPVVNTNSSFRVDYGNSNSPTFASLGALVRSYSICAFVDPDSLQVETFPIIDHLNSLQRLSWR